MIFHYDHKKVACWDGAVQLQLSSVQNPSIIPLYWLVYRDSPIGLFWIIISLIWHPAVEISWDTMVQLEFQDPKMELL